MPHRRPAIACALLLALAAGWTGAATAETFVTREALQAELRAPELQAAREALRQSLRSPDAALDALRAAKASAAPLREEYLLHEALLALRTEAAPPAELRAFVQDLTQHAPQVFTTPEDPDHGHGQRVIAFPVAAAARGTLAHWRITEQAERYVRELGAGRYTTLPEPADAAALAVAVRRLPDAALDGLVAAHLSALPAPALVAVLERRSEARVYRALLQQPADAIVLRTLPQVASRLPASEAFSVLQEATQRPNLASAAVLAMAPLAATHDEARRFLLQCLADETLGASCAQALAAQPSPAVVQALQAILAQGGDGPALRRALLALRWMDRGEAERALHAYADDPASSAALRAEVRSWLR